MTRKKIRLLTMTPQNGSAELVKQNEKTVWAEVGDIGVTTKFSAASAGKTAELQLTLWRSEYGGQSHAEVNGTVYKISECGAADNDLRIKLILGRTKA
ncbi:MAG: hypothetical protein NC394_10535 [Bacteroides sp.]|nr:hypothetical protein [Bacteroides sp.]